MLDGKLLLDFPCDTLSHTLREGIDLSEISDCLLTHTHADHLYPADLKNRAPGFSVVGDRTFTLWGSEGAMAYTGEKISAFRERMCGFATRVLPLYETTGVGEFSVTPLPAVHDPDASPVIYLIGNAEGKHLLYAHDTGFFADGVWQYFETHPVHLDLVSLDCTYGQRESARTSGHMNFAANLRVRDRLLALGVADRTTTFVANHFSHNGKGVLYDEFFPMAEEHGFLMSYDGMTVKV